MAKRKKAAKSRPKSKMESKKHAKVKTSPVRKAGGGSASVRSTRRSSWLDESSHKPLIDKYSRQLKSFINAMADGRIDEAELEEQEDRLVALMKDIEPQLDAKIHPKVTQLLCELTAYDLMRTLHSISANRPKTVFEG